MNKENIIVLPFGRDMIPRYELIREQIMSHPGVVNVSASYDLPFFLTSGVNFTWDTVDWEDRIGVSYNMVDFDFIEKGAEIGAPKYMEWYGAFGLIVTLIWLYLEILRLLAKLRRR